MESVFSISLACVLTPLVLSGAPDTSAVLDSVRVVGRRPPPAHVGVASHVRVDPTEGARSVADIVDDVTGVRVRRYGGLGAFATATVRGSSAGQVDVYVDGIPLNSAQWGGANLGNLSVDNLERVDVYRSGAPFALPATGIGGAINLITTDALKTRTRIRVGGGSYDTRKAAIQHTGRLLGVRHLLHYRQASSDGDFPYRYDPGTPVANDADDSERRRANNAFREQGTLLKLEHVGRSVTWHGQHEWFEKAYRIPGHGNLVYDAAHADVRRHAARVEVARPADGSVPFGTAAVMFLTDERSRYFNPEHEPGLSTIDLVHHARLVGGTLALTASLPAFVTWRVDGEVSRERFTPTEDRPGGEGATRERDRRAIRTGARVDLGEDVVVETTLRAAHVSDDFTRSPDFGEEVTEQPRHTADFRDVTVAFRAPLSPEWTFTATRGDHHRLPTLLELFGTQGDVVPSPNLAPERGTTWDAGLTWTPDPDASMTVTAFHATRDSLILFLQNSQRSFKATNIEASSARGLEVTLAARWRRLSIDANFTTQDVRHGGRIPYLRGRWLPYVSAREFFTRLRLDTSLFDVRYDVRLLDGYYTHPANLSDQRVGGRSVHGLGVDRHLFEDRLRVDLDVRNVLDEPITDVFGYPMPGRTIYVSIETIFRGDG